MTAAPVVICLGNDLRGDDGAGLEVARLLRPLLPAHVALLESDGDPAEIVDAWAGAPLAVVVDAVVSGSPPGTVHHRAGLDARAGSRPSSHALGLADAVALGRALGRLPADLAWYGIEAADLTLGRPLSPAVRAAARSVAEAVAACVTRAVAGGVAHLCAAACSPPDGPEHATPREGRGRAMPAAEAPPGQNWGVAHRTEEQYMTSTRPPAAAHVGPPPPFDPELEAVLTALGWASPPPIALDRVPAMREAGAAARTDPSDEQLSRGGEYEVADRTVPGPPDGPDVTLLVCRPAAATAPTPALYQIHGGGMMFGNRRSGLESTLDLAARVGAAVVSVEYRLAPEHPHPAPVEDCYAGLRWLAEHAAELNVDPARIVVAGDSAGGGLAAAVALLARDRGGPALAGQLLRSPMLDDRNDTPSAYQMTGLGVWDRAANETGWTALLGDARGGPDVSPYASPARATDLSGLPPAYLDVGSADMFRDEAVAYASAIWRDGGHAELHVWPGACHGFEMMAPHAAVTRAALDARHAWLQRLLGA